MRAATRSTLPFAARQLTGQALKDALVESRQRTWSLVDDLSDAQWLPEYQRGVNPVAWELAHLAWFAEFWILRGPHAVARSGFTQAARTELHLGPDAHLDSAQLAHADRWHTPMPPRDALKELMAKQLQACLDVLPAVAIEESTGSDAAHYFHRLALFHEDMHAEAFCWMRSALGYAVPQGMAPPHVQTGPRLHIAAASVQTGLAPSAPGFAFDNEMPVQTLALKAFDIDSAVVSSATFAKFVDAGGYSKADFWPLEAGRWRSQSGHNHPARWRKTEQGWEQAWFNQWLPVSPHLPVMQVSAYEAQAYCLWAGRGLPTAAQWEHAATSIMGFDWGHSVWEWTADDFVPYPGFTTGPYKEYSQPWFGNHRELRGGAFATHARMHHPRYRNFFQPHRNEVFAGFRTVSR